LASFGALSVLGIMAINFNVHSAHVKGYVLEHWQTQWETWIGAIVPFYAIALMLFIGMTLHERRERRQERRIHYLSKQKALEFQAEYLDSRELQRELDDTKPAIAAEVKRQLALPAQASSTRRHIGYGERDEDAGPK